MTETFDRRHALEQGIIHDENHERNRRQFKGLYGQVASRQNEFIIKHCKGHSILDVGAGYGNLTKQLIDSGKKVYSIEIDEEKIKRALEWFNIRIDFTDFYEWESPEKCVDTIIFREVVNHLDMKKTFEKAMAVTKYRCLIFHGTEIFPLRIAKKIYGHEEYDQKTTSKIIDALKQAGFIVHEVLYRDTLAYPLSGGWSGHCLIPPFKILNKLILKADKIFSNIVNKSNLGKYLCFRHLIIADKH